MSFDLQVQLSGLLHYIPNADPDPSRKVRLCIVLPEADNHHTLILAREGSGLELEGEAVGSPARFDNRRVTFRFNRQGTTEPGPLDYEGPMLNGDIKGVVPYNLIAGNNVNENPKVVSAQATAADGVRAQILLEEGIFFLPPDPHAELDLPGDLTGGIITPLKLAQRVFMRVENLDSAEIHVSPLSGEGPTQVFSIQPDANAQVLVGYLCPDLPANAPQPQTDEDFEFHYQLLKTPQAVAVEDVAKPVPIIRRLPPSVSGLTVPLRQLGLAAHHLQPFLVTAGGCDCAGWGGKATEFNLDDTLPAPNTFAVKLNPPDWRSPRSMPPA